MVPEAESETSEERARRAEKLAARRRELNTDAPFRKEPSFKEVGEGQRKMEVEEGELPPEEASESLGWSKKADEKWKSTMGGTVDMKKLKSLAGKLAKADSESDEGALDEGKGALLYLKDNPLSLKNARIGNCYL